MVVLTQKKVKRRKKEKTPSGVNHALQVIGNNEQLEQGTCLYVLSREGRFDLRLFDELMNSIRLVSTCSKLISVQLLYQLYIIQRIILLLQASHFDTEDLYCIESEPEHWREHLSELDTTIFTCIKVTRIRIQSTVSQSEN